MCLRFFLWNPIKILHFQSLLLHVSQSPQYRNLPFRFPSQSLCKESGALFPMRSLKCLTYVSDFPLDEPSLQVTLQYSHRERCSLFRALLYLSLKVPGKTTPHPLSFPKGPLWRELPVSRAFFYISLGFLSKQDLLLKQNLTFPS
jgi:hypothetical protein